MIWSDVSFRNEVRNSADISRRSHLITVDIIDIDMDCGYIYLQTAHALIICSYLSRVLTFC